MKDGRALPFVRVALYIHTKSGQGEYWYVKSGIVTMRALLPIV